ncbi:hypothetical protein [Paenibacillus contaminans]|uniref:Uncharacterized protein n=1 Tax=Paenibacillus contaminans TaxID=450362 RepID=A0A329MFU1_9BACL|nr:hypothetical protein [Paenibacillus contaminans]RAV18811.1 hypothetical protein DQG23_24080 [Paenibacillus contaminans]
MTNIIPLNVEELIRSEISPKIMSSMVSVVEQGYILAREATKHILFLDWDLGRKHEGYLRPIAIHYLFKRECEQGRLPFSLSIESNSNKSYKFLLFNKETIKMTLSQVDSPKVAARPAYFRKKLEESNQVRMNFFDDIATFDTPKEHYLQLTYSSGGVKPRFVNLGMPNGIGWFDKIDLIKEPRIVISTKDKLEKEEVIVSENLIGLRKFAEEVEGFGS